MNSMTGFGKAEFKDGYELTVEIRSVNNRFLDIIPKYPKGFLPFDDIIRKTVQKKLTRGRVDVFFTFNDMRDIEKHVETDIALAKAYYDSANSLCEKLGVENDLTVSRLMRLPDVINETVGQDDEETLKKIVVETLENALDNLNRMRAFEGEKLTEDLLSHIGEIEKTVNIIKSKAPLVAENYRTKIEERVKTVLEGKDIDEARLLQEVALFADKSDINEEITRLYSHISQFRSIVKTENAGRKLDFLIQEFNREANTICSKSGDIDITDCALKLKCEIEKIREQIQNIE